MQIIAQTDSKTAGGASIGAFYNAIKDAFPNIDRTRLDEEYARVSELAAKDVAGIGARLANQTAEQASRAI
jgi:hypothetical protein